MPIDGAKMNRTLSAGSVSSKRLRTILSVSLVLIGIVSLFTNVLYVYKFGPPHHAFAEPHHVRDSRSLGLLPLRKIIPRLHDAVSVSRSTPQRKVLSGSNAVSTASKTTPSVATTTTRRPLNGSTHVLVASYSDSISVLPKSLFQLSYLAKALSATSKLVEPWVFGYRAYGIKGLVPVVDKGMSTLALNRLFDMKSLNSLMSRCNGVPMVPYADFISAASREVVVVYLMRSSFNEPRQFHLLPDNEKKVTNMFKTRQIVDCLPLLRANLTQQAIGDLVDALNVLHSGAAFHVSSFVCVDNSKAIKLAELAAHLQPHTNTAGTVVLLNWRGLASLSKKPFDSSRYWVDVEPPTAAEDVCTNPLIPYHFEVPKLSHQFLAHDGITAPFLGVHIAIESLAKHQSTKYSKCCLQEANRVIGALIAKYHLAQAIVIGEYSTDRSTNCDTECVKKSLVMVHTLGGWGLNVTRYDPAAVGAKHRHLSLNRLVELSTLSTGGRLLVVGHSLWHSPLKARYYQHYPSDGVARSYAICTFGGTYLRELVSKSVNCDAMAT